MSFGTYVHIPFCEQHCHYCAFPVVVMAESAHRPYTECLRAEIRHADLPATTDTLYLGGGTPSLLAPGLLETLIDSLPRGATEISLEANPGTLDRNRIKSFLQLGINRISLGVQSFDTHDLKTAGRLHQAMDSVSDFEELRKAGFENINMDLIAGLPSQQPRGWEENIGWIERLGPDHVSVYLLETEDSSLWGKHPPQTPTEDEYVWFYSTIAERLAGAGYHHYEISSWALPGAECRHNLGYWTGVPYRGLGLGAHSFIGGMRFWNTRSMSEYRNKLDRGENPVDQIEERTVRIRVEEAFLLGLRRVDGFDVWAVAKDIGIDYPQEWFDRMDSLIDEGLVEFDGKILKLRPPAWLLANGVIEELLCPTLLSICEATP